MPSAPCSCTRAPPPTPSSKARPPRRPARVTPRSSSSSMPTATRSPSPAARPSPRRAPPGRPPTTRRRRQPPLLPPTRPPQASPKPKTRRPKTRPQPANNPLPGHVPRACPAQHARFTMQISAQLVKELRQRSGAGMMECKKALVENEGNVDTAMEWLRKQGLAKADKKAGRVAAEGRIIGAQDKGKAVLVEINCETDFVAKDKSFLAFADNVAKVALDSDSADIDALKAAAYPGGDGSVEDAAKALVATIGEKIDVRRVARGEGDGVIGRFINSCRVGTLEALGGGRAALDQI